MGGRQEGERGGRGEWEWVGWSRGMGDSGSRLSAGWEVVGARGGCGERYVSGTCGLFVVEFHINL